MASYDLLYAAIHKVLSEMRREYGGSDLQLLIWKTAEFEKPALFKLDRNDLHSADEINFLGVPDSLLLLFFGRNNVFATNFFEHCLCIHPDHVFAP